MLTPELMQQALEYLERHAIIDGIPLRDALRAALANELFGNSEELAQPEQEPVAWLFQHEETGRTMCVDAQQVEWGFEGCNPRLQKIAPLYTSPPQRQPLTDDEIVEALMPVEIAGAGYYIRIARAIEAKLKEKNT